MAQTTFVNDDNPFAKLQGYRPYPQTYPRNSTLPPLRALNARKTNRLALLDAIGKAGSITCPELAKEFATTLDDLSPRLLVMKKMGKLERLSKKDGVWLWSLSREQQELYAQRVQSIAQNT